MRIIAIEGPSYAGKSTLITAMRESLPAETVVLDCYVDAITDPGRIPPTRPATAQEQIAAFETFMTVEAARVTHLDQIRHDHRPQLVIMDRSADTLLAHAHAVEVVLGYAVFAQLRARVKQLPHLRPDHTFYLDVQAGELRRRRSTGQARRRNPNEGEAAYFLHDARILAQIREYFLNPPQPPVAGQITMITADGPLDQVIPAVLHGLQHQFS